MLSLFLAVALGAPCPSVSAEAMVDSTPPPPPPEGVAGPGTGSLRVAVVSRDDERPLSDIVVHVVGSDGVLRDGATDAEGRLVLEDLPEGLYNLTTTGITIEHLKVSDGRRTVQRVPLRGQPSFAGADPGEPPSSMTWLRYSRSACLGPCKAYDVTLEHGGKLTFDGQAFVRVEGEAQRLLSAKQLERLRQELDCIQTLPTFAAYQATDMVWTRLEVWERDGERWSWVWYSGDFRAPYAPLDKVRKKLERALGIERFK